MNYYKRHIGDYAAKTGHLSALEHGVYGLLIDAYYNRETAPTKLEAFRWAKARSKDEVAAVEAVLSEFFVEADGLYRQARIDDELAAYWAKQDTNRAIALAREQAKRDLEAARTAHETSTKRAPDVNLTNSHKPVASNQEEAKAPIAPKGALSEAAVLDAYHAILPSCQRVTVMNDKRKKRIAAAVKLARQVCNEQGWPYDAAEFWQGYFTECAADPWMRGEVPDPQRPNWKQNLDVLIREDRFAGVMDRAIATLRATA